MIEKERQKEREKDGKNEEGEWARNLHTMKDV